MLTIEKAREIFGELPKEVEEDSYYRYEFLKMYTYDVKLHGGKWCKEHRVDEIAAWSLIRTYL